MSPYNICQFTGQFAYIYVQFDLIVHTNNQYNPVYSRIVPSKSTVESSDGSETRYLSRTTTRRGLQSYYRSVLHIECETDRIFYYDCGDRQMSDHVYAYGVLEKQDLSLTVDGVEGATDLYTVDYKRLSVAVTDIETTDVERSDENVQAHDDVLQTILTHDDGRTIVPMSFGMAFKNARTLKGVVRGARRAFRKALNDIDGTVELGVKLVSAEDGDVPDLENVRDRLSTAAINETDDDLFSDRLLLNRSYLVAREKQAAFGEIIDDIEEEYGDALMVKYTGPFAPYSFVDIQIGAEGR